MRASNNYGLNLVEGTDIVNPLVHDVRNYEKIDEIMKENSDCGIPLATELLTGTVHALTRTKPDAPMFRFVATSKYSSGDTFTVDGVQVTALLTTGEPLKDGAYVINANVVACLVGTVLTLFCGQNNENVHAVDSDKLGGELPSHYASASSVVEAVNLAQSANQIALSNTASVSKLEKMKVAFPDYSAREYVISEHASGTYSWVADEDCFIKGECGNLATAMELFMRIQVNSENLFVQHSVTRNYTYIFSPMYLVKKGDVVTFVVDTNSNANLSKFKFIAV